MKQLVLCDNHCYHITDEDSEVLRSISPGLARLVRESDSNTPTHFVCGKCGQVSPLTLQGLHKCKSK